MILFLLDVAEPLDHRDAVLPLVEASADSDGVDDSFQDILANSSDLWLAGIEEPAGGIVQEVRFVIL